MLRALVAVAILTVETLTRKVLGIKVRVGSRFTGLRGPFLQPETHSSWALVCHATLIAPYDQLAFLHAMLSAPAASPALLAFCVFVLKNQLTS